MEYLLLNKLCTAKHDVFEEISLGEMSSHRFEPELFCFSLMGNIVKIFCPSAFRIEMVVKI